MSKASAKEKRIANALAHAAKCREEAINSQRAVDRWRYMDRGRELYANEIRIFECERDTYLRIGRDWEEHAVQNGWVRC